MDIRLPCKFSDNGCKEGGARSFMQEHIRRCIFGKFECPTWICKEMIPYGEVVDHLKNTHGSPVQIKRKFAILPNKIEFYSPLISFVHDQTFFLNCIKRDHATILCVTMLGTEEEAKTFEVKMTVGPNDDLCIRMPCKVYGIDIRKEDVLKDSRGIVEISESLANRMSTMLDGVLCIQMEYKITHKTTRQ